ncbi:MAG: hypothetical protein ABIA75_08925 [Candidatus Neomarinimicrobiota bacterium]
MGSIAEPSWLKIIIALFSGGMLVKLFEYFYVQKVNDRKSAAQLINKNLDPILKAADELVGKIRYLAQSDFDEFSYTDRPEGLEFSDWFTYLDSIYLFVQLWARIQIMRLEGIYTNLALNKRGALLLAFIRALESSKNQIVKRGWQRGMGESLIKQINEKYYTITFAEFTDRFLAEAGFRRWFDPLIAILENLDYQDDRQTLLVYGIIIHAMINTLDEKHQVTGRKPGWANKLTGKSRRLLQYRIFQIYLPFVKNPRQYYQVG